MIVEAYSSHRHICSVLLVLLWLLPLLVYLQKRNDKHEAEDDCIQMLSITINWRHNNRKMFRIHKGVGLDPQSDISADHQGDVPEYWIKACVEPFFSNIAIFWTVPYAENTYGKKQEAKEIINFERLSRLRNRNVHDCFSSPCEEHPQWQHTAYSQSDREGRCSEILLSCRQHLKQAEDNVTDHVRKVNSGGER